MPLPDPVVAFLRSWEALLRRCTAYQWGTVTRDERFPLVWDANRALVAGTVTPSAAEVRAAIHRLDAQLAVGYEQVEVVDLAGHASLAAELEAIHGAPLRFTVMTAEPAHVVGHDPGLVRAEPSPGEETWLALVRAMHADEDSIPDLVQRQVVARDVEVTFRVGRRLFLARRDNEPAGMATLLSRDGVGLVDDVATAPGRRRQGMASAVVSAIARAAHANGDALLLLFTREGSDAERLYRRLGFSAVSVSGQFHGAGDPEALNLPGA